MRKAASLEGAGFEVAEVEGAGFEVAEVEGAEVEEAADGAVMGRLFLLLVVRDAGFRSTGSAQAPSLSPVGPGSRAGG